jgi:hypothetical protein
MEEKRNPYQAPDEQAMQRRYVSKPLIMAATTWFIQVGLAVLLGAIASLYTGRAEELPNWNGWSYMFFSARDFAMVGMVVALPMTLIVLCLTWLGFKE